MDPLNYLGYSQLQNHNNFCKVVSDKVVKLVMDINFYTESIFIKAFLVELQ